MYCQILAAKTKILAVKLNKNEVETLTS